YASASPPSTGARAYARGVTARRAPGAAIPSRSLGKAAGRGPHDERRGSLPSGGAPSSPLQVTEIADLMLQARVRRRAAAVALSRRESRAAAAPGGAGAALATAPGR